MFYFATSKIEDKRSSTENVKIVVYLVFALVIFVVIPFLIQRTLRKHRYGLYLSMNRNKFGSLYLGVKTNAISSIFCVFSFLIVRSTFVIMTFAMITIPGILVNFYMLINNFNIIYIGWYKPYDTWA